MVRDNNSPTGAPLANTISLADAYLEQDNAVFKETRTSWASYGMASIRVAALNEYHRATETEHFGILARYEIGTAHELTVKAGGDELHASRHGREIADPDVARVLGVNGLLLAVRSFELQARPRDYALNEQAQASYRVVAGFIMNGLLSDPQQPGEDPSRAAKKLAKPGLAERLVRRFYETVHQAGIKTDIATEERVEAPSAMSRERLIVSRLTRYHDSENKPSTQITREITIEKVRKDNPLLAKPLKKLVVDETQPPRYVDLTQSPPVIKPAGRRIIESFNKSLAR